MPIVVIDGFVQIRDSSDPVPIVEHPVEQPGLLAQAGLVVVEVGGHPGPQARDRDLALVVVQAREHPHQGGERVGHGPAEHAGVDAVVERGHGDDGSDHAAQRRRERRFADRPVGGVGQHDRVGAQLLSVPLEDGGQRVGADLLLPLDEDRHPDGERPGVGPQRRDVGHDAGLVVGGTATVETPAALGRLERRAVPQRLVAGRLHVVVRVEHDGARAGRAVDVADDGGAAALAHDLDLESLGAQQRGGRLGARLDVRTGRTRRGSRSGCGSAPRGRRAGRASGRRRGHGGRRWSAGSTSVTRPTLPTGRATAGRACTASGRQHLQWGVFGRSKTTNDQLVDELHPQRDGAKNRPTPKRKDQEAARRSRWSSPTASRPSRSTRPSATSS